MKTALRHSAPLRTLRFVFSPWATGLLLIVGLPAASARDLSISELTTISSMVHKEYQQEKLPDGSYKPVRYAFGEGTFDSAAIADPSAERLKFPQLAVLLSGYLARLGYQPNNDVKNIDQLIMVHWGRTGGRDGRGYGDIVSTQNNLSSAISRTFPNPGSLQGNFGPGQITPATRGLGGEPGAASELDYNLLLQEVQERARHRANTRNALLLGYYDTLRYTPTFFGNLVSPRRERLMQEVEDDRYYVVLIAYDFQATRKSRQPTILWITRFSLQTRGNDFDQCIDRMIHAAAPYFGRSSDGLKRERLPEGRAVPGDLKFLEYLERTK